MRVVEVSCHRELGTVLRVLDLLAQRAMAPDRLALDSAGNCYRLTVEQRDVPEHEWAIVQHKIMSVIGVESLMPAPQTSAI